MRVAYVCADPGIPAFGAKGGSVHIQEVLRSLLRRGDQVTLFTPRPGGRPGPGLEAVEVVALPAVVGDTPEEREASAGSLDGHVSTLLRRHGPFDLVYERYALWSSAGVVTAAELGIPGILEVNSPLIEEQATHRGLVDRAQAELVTARAFAAASVIVTVSREVAAWVEGFSEADGKVSVVPNGVDPTRFEPGFRPRHLGGFTIGFVGTLKPWHDLDTLVEAFGLLAGADSTYRLLVVGDGPRREAIQDRLKEMGLGDRVELTGAVDPTDVPRHLARMDVAVAPYPDSGEFYFSPLKLFEYMAAGVPVVATDIGQIAEVIEPGRTGLVYPAGDAQALADRVSRLRSDPYARLSMQQAGREVAESHTWDDVVETVLGLVEPDPLPGDEMPRPRWHLFAVSTWLTLWTSLLATLRLLTGRLTGRIKVASGGGLMAGLRRLRGAGGVFRPHLKGEWKIMAGGAGAMVAEIALRLLEPWPLKFIFDRVIQPDPDQAATGMDWADAMDPMVLLVASAVAVVVFTALRALSAYGSTVAFALAGNRVLTGVRARLYSHLQRLSLSFHTKARSGDLLTRVTGDIGRLQEVAVTAALPLVVNLATFAGMLAVMLWMDWRLTLIALAAVPFFTFTLFRLSGRIRTVARKQRTVEGALASVAAESLAAIQVVQTYSLEEPFEKDFGSQNQASLRDGVQAKRLAAALERKTDVFVAIGTGLVLYFGARLVMSGSLTPGDLIVFVAYLKSAFKPMRDIAKFSGRIAKAAASAERISELLELAPDVIDRPGAVAAPSFRGEIRFEGVGLAYDDGDDVVSDLSLHIPAESRVALVGPSGTGKSSLVGLLLRLYEPDRGRITIDGHDLSELTLESVRRQMAVVLQDSVLFRASIRENIAFGDLDASPEEIEAAARLANAHDFVSALPQGYDTVVGERGATLSGGERQRIAIARAALRDAPILILDEPTTGLDGAAEASVMEALGRVMDNRTVVHITHDLSTVSDADMIIYLDSGQVRESGTHQELLAASGAYTSAYGASSPANGDHNSAFGDHNSAVGRAHR